MGNCLFLLARGWGIDRQVRKKLQIPGGMPGGGMVTGRIEPCITVLSVISVDKKQSILHCFSTSKKVFFMLLCITEKSTQTLLKLKTKYTRNVLKQLNDKNDKNQILWLCSTLKIEKANLSSSNIILYKTNFLTEKLKLNCIDCSIQWWYHIIDRSMLFT